MRRKAAAVVGEGHSDNSNLGGAAVVMRAVLVQSVVVEELVGMTIKPSTWLANL
uniref:Uncharacterized protein n=1 Tax=Romanomermis culicivorax TaxID=13658 RepID=A0A915HZX3_ROMCU